jgi:SAM-dependent methyltransferase
MSRPPGPRHRRGSVHVDGGGAGFDAWAPAYEHSILQPTLYEPAQQAVLELARQLAPQPRRVLDVGCGTGRLLRHARRHHPSTMLVGVDSSTTMVAVAASTAPRVGIHYLRAAAERLPFASMRFDVVLVTMSLRHWNDLEAGIEQVHRVLAGGGVLVIADVFPADPRRSRLRRWTRDRLGLPVELTAVLRAHGLTPVARNRVPWPLLPDIQIIAARKPIQQPHGTGSRPGPVAATRPWPACHACVGAQPDAKML